MGHCKICGASAAFGFAFEDEKGQRRYAWACRQHRDEMQARYDAWKRDQTALNRPSLPPAQPQPGGGGKVSGGAQGAEQGKLI